MTSTWKTATNFTRNAWNADTPGYAGWFSKTTGTDPEIKVYDDSYAQSWSGLASGGCASGGSQPWYNDLVTVKINLNHIDGMNALERVDLVIHEFGHALGLAHSTFGCSWPGPVIMREDALYAGQVCDRTDSPFQNDISGAEWVYD